MLRMASVLFLVECEEQVSMIERVSSVGVTDGSSLTDILVSACAIVLLLAAADIGLFVLIVLIVLVVFVWALFHRWYRKAS